MPYEVEVSELAESQYNAFLHYLYYDLKNEQAVKNLMNDFDDTISILEQDAGSFAYCQNERLRGKGLYKLNFQLRQGAYWRKLFTRRKSNQSVYIPVYQFKI